LDTDRAIPSSTNSGVSTARIRAEVVGSLLRPARLLNARTELIESRIDTAEFKCIEDAAVDEAVSIQESAGIEAITDGEQRRALGFFGNFVAALEGIEPRGRRTVIFRDETGEELPLSLPVVTGKLRRRHSMVAEEWTYLRARAGKLAQGDADQPGTCRQLLAARHLHRRLSDSGGVPGARRRHPAVKITLVTL
jgi:5-methyltetrahydropteroyltriglutamate--homocysteine methyltransferase